MSISVAVIDYGMGNLHSVASALQHVGADKVLVTHDANLIRQADPSPLLSHIKQHAGAFFVDQLHSFVELRAAIAAR